MVETSSGYQFGGWLVEPHLNRVSRADDVHQIEPRTMDVLAHLLEHDGQVVTSNELLDRFWNGRVGEPGMISKRVGQIRRALGDDPRRPTYIETISRRGYRTVAKVTKAVPEPVGVASIPAAQVIRYTLAITESERLVSNAAVSIALSEDGASLAYIGAAATGRQIWIRDRDKLKSTPLVGTQDAVHPFFSPDGVTVGYITDSNQLKRIPRSGGAPQILVLAGVAPFSAHWDARGWIYYQNDAGIARVSVARGGASEQITRRDPAHPEVIGHAAPQAFPNGKGLLFSILKNHLVSEVAVANLETGEYKTLAEGIPGRYASSGHLVFVGDDFALRAAPFDQDTLMLTGPIVRLDVQLPVGITPPDLALSATGRLAYVTRPRIFELVWVGRDGAWSPVDPDNPIRGVRYGVFSPDDSMLAVTSYLRPPNDYGHLWIKHLPHGAYSRLTFEDEGEVNMRPWWTPDGKSVTFISDRGGHRAVWQKRVDGTNDAELLFDYADIDIDEAFYSADGAWLVHRRGMLDRERDILAIRPNVDAEPTSLVVTSFDALAPAVSTDGRWLAYVSAREGIANVYVRPFPEANTELQVSVQGGAEPVWGRSGPELFYRNGAGDMVAVTVEPGDDFKIGPEQVLFSTTAYRRDYFHAGYHVSADDQTFVMVRTSESAPHDKELVMVENWFEELRHLAPSDGR